jgi:hypothetical protein
MPARFHEYSLLINLKQSSEFTLIFLILKHYIFKNKFSSRVYLKKRKIVVNKSPHVNVKAKKRYLYKEYFLVLQNVNKIFLKILFKNFKMIQNIRIYKRLV